MNHAQVEILSRAMLAAWAGEPLPDVDSPEYAQFEAALVAVVGEAKPLDMQALGCVAGKALLRYLRDGLAAQRATARAELKARGSMQ